MDSTNTWAVKLVGAWLALSPCFPTPAAADLPQLTHAISAQADMDPAGYWISEKLDGVRAYWDGEKLFFRSGREIAAPAWFIAGLPRQALDGELWIGRGRFERLSGIVRKGQPVDEEWREVRYRVYEQPGGEGDFSARLARLERLITAAGLAHVEVLPQFRLETRADLQAKLAEVVKGGGEGLMLHRATAGYQSGRSRDLLKLKPWDDAEAVVLAHLPGQGKYAGRLGALRVQLADGRMMRIGSGLSDAQRIDPPAIDSIITFRYRGETSSGLPRFATFLRVREAF